MQIKVAEDMPSLCAVDDKEGPKNSKKGKILLCTNSYPTKSLHLMRHPSILLLCAFGEFLHQQSSCSRDISRRFFAASQSIEHQTDLAF